MTELLTAAQMRAIEQAAIASGKVTGLELMERAGAGVVEAVFEEWPEFATGSHRAVVLCGPGNNGGKGFVVARLLKERGWEVEVFLYGDPEKMPREARENYERWIGLGSVERYSDHVFSLDQSIWDSSTLMFDAFFGTGLQLPLVGFDAAAWVTQISEWRLQPQHRTKAFPGCRVIAVDFPSGFCANTGRCLLNDDPRQEVFRADLTVTFHHPKQGHFSGDGPEACGKVVVKDIGL